MKKNILVDKIRNACIHEKLEVALGEYKLRENLTRWFGIQK